MKLTLEKIHYYGDAKNKLYMSISVDYGWDGTMYTDLVRINFDLAAGESYVTVKILNHGIVLVVERLFDIIKNIHFKQGIVENPVETILESFTYKLGMKFNYDMVDVIIKESKLASQGD